MEKTGAQPLGDILKSFLAETGLGRELVSVDVCGAWRKTVGKRAADATSRMYFKDGVLYCTVSSSIIRNNLYFGLDGIKAEINASLGNNTVRKIVLK